MELTGRSLLQDADLTAEEFVGLLDLAHLLRSEKRGGRERRRLEGRNIALIFEKTSTRTRSAFEVAAHDQGASATYLGPDETQIGRKESMRDTARVLGRMYDGIEYRGFAQRAVEQLAHYSGVPVWNGLTDEWHPTQALADMMTMRDHTGQPLDEITFAYVGDAYNNTARSLLVAGALLGMNVRIGAPKSRWPAGDARTVASDFAKHTGARLIFSEDPAEAVRDADFIYTDVWLSMGEPSDKWDERVDLLLPYQVNAALLKASENPNVKFLHCLPALHNRETEIGQAIFERRGLDALEVTEDVFESPTSIVFDQAENRLHTIKAILVATLSGSES